MDKNYIKSVIENLKSTSSTRVQETLLKIRSKIATNDEGIKLFRENGGFELLLPHLRKPNERILDITLSILGNCCLETESSILVGKLNSFGPLVNIVKNVCRDSIVGRACRVIGNLAQTTSNAEGLHNHGAVSALTTLIENRDKNTSYPTLSMAVRAIRQLWMVTEKREEMLGQSVVRCIAILLTVECESAGIIKSTTAKETEGFRKSQEELVTGILKCLGHFTTHATVPCAEQIEGDGRGYQCLVALTKTHEQLALKCLMNLCYVSSCRPLLGNAGFVECLVNILEKNSVSDASRWPDGAVRALARLSGESVNRSRLRHARGLRLLLMAARTDMHALLALLQYVFDETSFQILIDEGLISFLTEELTTYVQTMQYNHQTHEQDSDVEKEPETETCTKDKENVKSEVTEGNSKKSNLFRRRRQTSTKSEQDELKVVIERDNMIVGFIDAMNSDSSDVDSDQDDEVAASRRGSKRPNSRSPTSVKKKSLIKMAGKEWSSSVYWEPKSPEGWSGMSPARSESSGLSPRAQGLAGRPRPRWDASPESGISSSSPYWTDCQWSPASSSGAHSPFTTQEESSDSEMSGRYSPVCSETEDGDATSEPTGELIQVHTSTEHVADDLVDDASSNDGDVITSYEDALRPEVHTKLSRVSCVLILLFRASHGAPRKHEEQRVNYKMELLAEPNCLNALLDYVERSKWPVGRAFKILYRVVSTTRCVLSVLKHGFPLRFHNMTVNTKHSRDKCYSCSRTAKIGSKLLTLLTTEAESLYAIGEISYQLLKGGTSIKKTLSVSLPYVVRTKKPLKKYFIDCDALNILLTTVAEATEEIQHSVVALAKLAQNVDIKDPKTLEQRFSNKIYVTYDPILDNLSSDEIVTFELDDLSTVQANKVFLCQNSEVFTAMLMGCFKESAQEYVHLKNVSKNALEHLLTLLSCGVNNPKGNVDVFPLSDVLETNLEVLLLADRFLFDKMKDLLSSAILQFQLSSSNADKVYAWSLSEGMGFLCVESVAYLLTGKMCDVDRTQAFRNIMSMEYKEQWLDDIKCMILRQLAK